MRKKLLVLGHIVEDISEPINIIGGGVSYSGIAAKELGFDVAILTKIPTNHPYIAEFNIRDIQVITAPSSKDSITTFTNTYDDKGRRTQIVHDWQEQITTSDIAKVNINKFDESFFLVAPVIGEIDTSVISLLATYGMVVVTPQGYFRGIKKDGTVIQQKWVGFEKDLNNANIIIFSNEDISVDGNIDKELLRQIRAYVPITVLTQGEHGATIFTKDMKFHTSAFHLEKYEINDLTGAGDAYAAAFITNYSITRNVHTASVFASLYAAIKIINKGVGIETIPTVKKVKDFIANNPLRLNEFFRKNNFSKRFYNL